MDLRTRLRMPRPEKSSKLSCSITAQAWPASALDIKLAIEGAICEKAPDVTAIEVEGVVEHAVPPSASFVPVEHVLLRGVEERCELCRVELAPEHQHLLNPVSRQLLC